MAMHCMVSGIIEWRAGVQICPPGMINVKTRPQRSLYFGFYYSFGFHWVVFWK